MGTPNVFRAAVDSGEFLCATVSYNSMNPLGGGVLASDKNSAKGNAGGWYGALRFLLENGGITAALLGVSAPEQIDRDMSVISDFQRQKVKQNRQNL